MCAAEEAPRPLLSGVILAAGAGSRVGRLKQLLPLGDRCLLQHVVDAAVDSGLDEVLLVLGHGAAEIRKAIGSPGGRRLRMVVNADPARGQSASLRLGLRAADARSEAAAILLGDQPGVTAQLVDRVAAAFRSAGRPAARPVYPDAGGVPGHPVFLARRIWPELAKLSGDEGARELLSAHPDWLFEVPIEGEPPGDIDTWEDYERAAHLAGLPLPRR